MWCPSAVACVKLYWWLVGRGKKGLRRGSRDISVGDAPTVGRVCAASVSSLRSGFTVESNVAVRCPAGMALLMEMQGSLGYAMVMPNDTCISIHRGMCVER